jgi:hypothetical protein
VDPLGVAAPRTGFETTPATTSSTPADAERVPLAADNFAAASANTYGGGAVVVAPSDTVRALTATSLPVSTNDAEVKLLAFYHLLPAPDGVLARRLFAQGLSDARHGDWTIADDGTLYTLPLGSRQIQIGRIDE